VSKLCRGIRRITRPYEWRLQQLKALRKLFVDHRREIIDAVRKDLGKQMDMEALSSEYNLPLAEIDENIAHLKSWMKPGIYINIANIFYSMRSKIFFWLDLKEGNSFLLL
jgi:hypothetical protein